MYREVGEVLGITVASAKARATGARLFFDGLRGTCLRGGAVSPAVQSRLGAVGAAVSSHDRSRARCHSRVAGAQDAGHRRHAGSRLRRVAEYVQANLAGELRLAELSTLVHMSPYHFARLFKKSTGVTPRQFVIRRRIEAALLVLADRQAPIGEVARTVGFRSQSHFTTTFRRVTGVTQATTVLQPALSSAGLELQRYCAFLPESYRECRSRVTKRSACRLQGMYRI